MEGRMLKSLAGLQGVPFGDANRDAGVVEAFLIDIDKWVVPHAVVNGNRSAAREVFVSPQQLRNDEEGSPVAVIDLVEPTSGGIVDSRELFGIHLEALDGPIGHLDDLVVDEDTWRVRYVVVDPKNWWLGKHVLISPHWIDRFDWPRQKVHVQVKRDAIKSAPEYDPGLVLTRDDEAAMFRHYQRQPYWSMQE
jgi:hypothetical protein